jgi:multidrug transporter EmrE-like cation transporter
MKKMNVALIAIYVLATVGGLILLKLGTGGEPLVSVVEGKTIWNISIVSVLGLLSYGISFLLYMFLISKFDLGFIVPLTTGLVYILVFIASLLIFKEAFSVIKVLAVVLIVAGVILLNVKSTST